MRSHKEIFTARIATPTSVSGRAWLLLASILLVQGCKSGADSSPVVVTVNGRAIHRDRLEQFLSVKLGELGTSEASDSIRSQMLDEYVQRQLVLDEAGRSGLAVSETEIDQAAQEDPQLKSTASASEARREMAADILVEKYYKQVVLKDVKVTPEEIEEYIQKNQSRLTDKPGFYVREIRVQSKEEADRLRQELEDGHHDFATEARLHSDAPNAADGGLARYEEGQLPDPLEKAITPLGPGDVSGVVESGYGFHIFKLEKRIQPYSPEERRSRLDDRRKQLAEELIQRRNQEAVDKALKELVSKAEIKVDDSALGFTYSGALRHN
jgi:parvulin-like peptidyl-prolyl isomerase